MFITTAKANSNSAKIAIAPGMIGKIIELKVGTRQYILNDGAFLCCTAGCDYSVSRVNGIGNAIFGGSGGFYNLVTKGSGTFFINSFGDLVKVRCSGNLHVDNSHAVAWDSTLNYTLKDASGNFGFKSGEGLIMEFIGEGDVYIQTRSVHNLANLIIPYVPSHKKS